MLSDNINEAERTQGSFRLKQPSLAGLIRLDYPSQLKGSLLPTKGYDNNPVNVVHRKCRSHSEKLKKANFESIVNSRT